MSSCMKPVIYELEATVSLFNPYSDNLNQNIANLTKCSQILPSKFLVRQT